MDLSMKFHQVYTIGLRWHGVTALRFYFSFCLLYISVSCFSFLFPFFFFFFFSISRLCLVLCGNLFPSPRACPLTEQPTCSDVLFTLPYDSNSITTAMLVVVCCLLCTGVRLLVSPSYRAEYSNEVSISHTRYIQPLTCACIIIPPSHYSLYTINS